MKKKTGITKTLALVLTLGLLCSGLTGCGQTQNSRSAAESLMTESTQPAESTEAVMESTEATADVYKRQVAIRNIRRDGNDAFKKLAKTEVSEDEIKGLEEELQKLTDKYVKDIDALIDSKAKEIMTV